MKRLSGADQEWLWSEMAHAVRTAQPLPEALRELAEANAGTRRAAAAQRIADALFLGKTLPQAVAEDRNFALGAAEAIEGGARGGRLDAVLESLAQSSSADDSLRRNILQAVCYPIVIGVGGLAAVLLLQLEVLPLFTEMYKELQVQLPIITQAMLSGVAALVFAVLVGSALALLLIYVVPARSLPFRRFFDSLRSGAPLMGGVMRRQLLSRWCGTMAILVHAGVPEPQAVRLAGRSTGHSGVEAQSGRLAAELEKGRPLAEAMQEESFFPPPLVWMVSASQRIGGHSEIWPAAQDMYRAQGERLAYIVSVALRVIFIALAILMVAVTATSLFLPLIKLMNSLGGS